MSEKSNNLQKMPWAAILIVIVMGVIPLIVHYYDYEAHLSAMPWYPQNEQTGDFFNYYKSKALTIVAGLMLIMIIAGDLSLKKYPFHKAMIPLGIYAAFVILSTIFSEYRYFSLLGMDEHFETVYVLLSYCVLVVFCYWFTNSKKNVKIILYAWMISIAVMCVIGILQVTGNDLYKTALGRFLLLPKSLRDTSEITFNFDAGRVYLTLYNPNYVGFYAALTVPILTILFVFTKNKILKVISIVLNSLVVLCLMGSGARNGMIALAGALLFMLLLFRKSLKKYWLWFTIAYASMIAVAFAFDAVNGGIVTERLENGFDVIKDADAKLQHIETNDENVTITYEGNQLVLTMVAGEDDTFDVVMRDSEGNDVSAEKLDSDVTTYAITDERFPFEVSVGSLSGVDGFAVEIEGKKWGFSNQINGYDGYYFYSQYGNFTKIEEAETAIFTNYSTLASGRGYLWARTIPLLKNYIFLGSGPDTFAVIFPRRDYVAASRLGFDKMLVTKPHDLYLQIATQTGVVSLLAFLAFNGFYLVECLKIYWKKEAKSFLEYIGMAMMIAVIAYLISGIINDSTVTIAPTYWCMMGLGLAVNRMVQKEDIH